MAFSYLSICSSLRSLKTSGLFARVASKMSEPSSISGNLAGSCPMKYLDVIPVQFFNVAISKPQRQLRGRAVNTVKTMCFMGDPKFYLWIQILTNWFPNSENRGGKRKTVSGATLCPHKLKKIGIKAWINHTFIIIKLKDLLLIRKSVRRMLGNKQKMLRANFRKGSKF